MLSRITLIAQLAVCGFLCSIILVSTGGRAGAQYAAPQVQLPPPLYVRFDGPAGMKVTFYRGALAGQTHQAPCVVGLRPGYVYRVQLSGLAKQPGAPFFPTLEVSGSVQMPYGLRGADQPATLYFTEQDFTAVADGALVTKVIALESAETAVPLATRADRPLEFGVGVDRDPVAAAREFGRPLLIARMGQRQFAPDELAYQGVPGTILLPGERVLPPPRDPPRIPWTCIPLVDPRLGPPSPLADVCFPNGGDRGLSAGYTRDGRLMGLEPADTIAEYTDSKGQRRITPSNRTGICSPRFIVTRGETATGSNLASYGSGLTRTINEHSAVRTHTPTALGNQNESLVSLAARHRPSGPYAYLGASQTREQKVTTGESAKYGAGLASTVQERGDVRVHTQPLERHQNEHLAGTASRQRVSAVLADLGSAVFGRVEGQSVVSTLYGTGNVTGVPLQKPLATEPADLPLLLEKWPDKSLAAIGEIVTVYLKYTNRGGRPITDIAVTDSLPARLEYVPGSAKADRDAVFTMQRNDAGSLILRWEINGALPPGQSGLVSFQATIR